ncbi:MAG: DUF262 domain-containing protein [Ignavibacteria bacterium]|nr:DUF262 domain-containing protein [Ignavibacteria bacterium]
MKADAKALNFLTNESIITIPFFQRAYVWDEANWAELFDDLLSDKYHFLGSLIFKQQMQQTGQVKEVLLIDGQQRLTTISILLKSISDNFDPETRSNIGHNLFNYVYFKRDVTGTAFETKIKHSKNDKTSFLKIMLTPPPLNLSNEDKICCCYNYFNKRIEEILSNTTGVDELRRLYGKIIDFNYKLFVVIDLEATDDEQEIFDTINSSGVRLSSADIIKNAIFQRAMAVNNSIEGISILYREFWENVFQKDPDIEKEWLTQRNTGRIRRDNIEILFHSYAVIKGFFDPEKHTLSNLSSLYKQYISNFNFEEIKALLVDVGKYAQIFYDNIIAETDLYSFEKHIHRSLHIIEELDLTTFYPLVLFILKESDDAYTYLIALEKYIFRRSIANKTVKNYNKEVKDFINDLQSLVTKSSSDTTNAELKAGLQSIKNSKASLILFWLELYRRNNDGRFGIRELKYNYTLEHILPRKWQDHWSAVPIYNELEEIIAITEKAEEVRNSLLNSLGNMTLLTSKLNSSVSNSCFSVKVKGDGRKRGIKQFADLSICKEVIQNEDSSDKAIWDERDIRKRNENLLKEIVNIW